MCKMRLMISLSGKKLLISMYWTQIHKDINLFAEIKTNSQMFNILHLLIKKLLNMPVLLWNICILIPFTFLGASRSIPVYSQTSFT